MNKTQKNDVIKNVLWWGGVIQTVLEREFITFSSNELNGSIML